MAAIRQWAHFTVLATRLAIEGMSAEICNEVNLLDLMGNCSAYDLLSGQGSRKRAGEEVAEYGAIPILYSSGPLDSIGETVWMISSLALADGVLVLSFGCQGLRGCRIRRFERLEPD
jgi:hypothetical protein